MNINFLNARFMKTKITLSVVFTLMMSVMFAQNQTIVTANSVDISDQLDLRAVATLFGESRNLQEFERNINDPELMISNLDLNGDNFVDYLRVIEHRERNTHLIILRAVLDRDVVQDVATIEVESNRRRRRAQIQVVGNPFIYGNNFIIEPVFAFTPVIYNHFWQPTYTLWVSPWNWGYYPTFFTAWHPCNMNFYYGHVNYWAGFHNFNYVSYRRFNRAMTMYNRYHVNTFANLYPNRSFINRHQNFRNAHVLADSRGSRDFRQVSTRETSAIKGIERVTSNRGEGGRTSTAANTTGSRVTAATAERTGNRGSATTSDRTGSRETNTNGRETATSSDARPSSDRNYQVGREVASGQRETMNTTRPTTGRETVNDRDVNVRPSNTNRPVASASNARPSVERGEVQTATRPQSTRPVYQEAKPARSEAAQAPSRTAAREQAPARTSAPASNDGRERKATPAASDRSSQGRSRG
jgi:hypothetical protein